MRLRPAVILGLSVGACSGDPAGSSAPDCTAAAAYTIGGSVSGSLGAGDCRGPDGGFSDPYSFTTNTSTSFRATLTATGFAPNLILLQGTAASLSTAKTVFDGESSANAFIPAGSYVIVVAADDGKTGSYTLTSGSSNTSDCSIRSFIFRGASASGTINANDCVGGMATIRQDIYEVYMESGSSVTINATSNRPGAVLFRSGTAASADLVSRMFNSATGGSATFSYTATSSGFYRVHMLNELGTTTTANYSFSIS